MRRDQYSAVVNFRLTGDALPSGLVSGFAAPAKGSNPCAVALVADANLIAIAGAVEFSDRAAQLGIRLGWCGFTIGGFGQAAIMANHVELRCFASDKVLAWWDSSIFAFGLETPYRTPIRIEQMLSRLRKVRASSDIEQVLPFGVHLARRRGTKPFLVASWNYFLSRQINVDEIEEWGGFDYTEANMVRDLWNTIMLSPECNMGRYYSRPGPFDITFPFPLDAFI